MGRRSTGCRKCIERRIRCDENRPCCHRCLQSGLRCPGPRDPQASYFLDETAVTQRRYVRPKKQKASQPAAVRAQGSIPRVNELSLSAFASDIYQAFLLNRFVSMGSQYTDHVTNGVWMRSALSHPQRYPHTALALSALSTSFFGRQHHQRAITIQSYSLYSSTLGQINTALHSSTNLESDDILSTVAALLYYEYLAFTSTTGWLHHAEALAMLMQSRGPKAFRNVHERSILDSVRMPLISASMLLRKPCFLDDEEWRYPSWYAYPKDRHFVKLEHLFAKIAGIDADIQNLEEARWDMQACLPLFEDVGARVEDLQRQLSDWYLIWTGQFSRLPTSIPSTQVANVIFSEVFEFDDLICAKGYIDYWTIATMCHERMHKLAHPVWERGLFHEGMYAIPETKSLAINICRSVEYFLRPIHIEAAPWYLSHPIRIAYLALPRESPEAQWLFRTLRAMGEKHEVGLSRNILDNMPRRKLLR